MQTTLVGLDIRKNQIAKRKKNDALNVPINISSVFGHLCTNMSHTQQGYVQGAALKGNQQHCQQRGNQPTNEEQIP